MTVKEWLESKMDEARNDVENHEVAAQAAKARFSAYLDMWDHLPKERMEIQIVGETPTKE
jgi:hypothetical protein